MTQRVTLTVNGTEYILDDVEPRHLLSDVVRERIGLTGTHVGCEHGVCGACTVVLDGRPVRSCLMFAAQAQGHAIETVEALAPAEGALSPLQQALHERHGLQCGFCTPGILMTMTWFLREHPQPTRAQIREALSGNLCRCTGYEGIVDAVESVAQATPLAADITSRAT
jgi:carbon-monoxide dehydrogenase small subunit